MLYGVADCYCDREVVGTSNGLSCMPCVFILPGASADRYIRTLLPSEAVLVGGLWGVDGCGDGRGLGGGFRGGRGAVRLCVGTIVHYG